MVLTDSHGIPRAPCYSGTPARAADWRSGYGTHTLSGRPFKAVRLHHCTTPPTAGRQSKQDPTTPCAQPLPGITHARFGPIRVRSPLLTESLLFSLPAGTEMFHFPAFPPHRLCVQRQVTTPPRGAWRGFPIRTPWDHSPVIDSPRLIADSHVLHRLPMPRHPPCALGNLKHKKTKDTHKRMSYKKLANKIARCSRPLYSSQTTTPTTRTRAGRAGRAQEGGHHTPHRHTHPTTGAGAGRAGTAVPGPNSVPRTPPPTQAAPAFQPPEEGGVLAGPRRQGARATNPIDVPPTSTRRTTSGHETGLLTPQGRHAMRPPAPTKGAQCSLERR